MSILVSGFPKVEIFPFSVKRGPSPLSMTEAVPLSGEEPLQSPLSSSSETNDLFKKQLSGKKVFIDFAKEDALGARHLEEELQQLFENDIVVSSSSSVTSYDDLQKNLKDCDVVILTYEKAPHSWLRARENFYRVVKLKHKQGKTWEKFFYNPSERKLSRFEK